MGFSRQEYWSGWPCPPPGDLPDPGIKPTFPASPAMQADSLLPSHLGSLLYIYIKEGHRRVRVREGGCDDGYRGWSDVGL